MLAFLGCGVAEKQPPVLSEGAAAELAEAGNAGGGDDGQMSVAETPAEAALQEESEPGQGDAGDPGTSATDAKAAGAPEDAEVSASGQNGHATAPATESDVAEEPRPEADAVKEAAQAVDVIEELAPEAEESSQNGQASALAEDVLAKKTEAATEANVEAEPVSEAAEDAAALDTGGNGVEAANLDEEPAKAVNGVPDELSTNGENNVGADAEADAKADVDVETRDAPHDVAAAGELGEAAEGELADEAAGADFTDKEVWAKADLTEATDVPMEPAAEDAAEVRTLEREPSTASESDISKLESESEAAAEDSGDGAGDGNGTAIEESLWRLVSESAGLERKLKTQLDSFDGPKRSKRLLLGWLWDKFEGSGLPQGCLWTRDTVEALGSRLVTGCENEDEDEVATRSPAEPCQKRVRPRPDDEEDAAEQMAPSPRQKKARLRTFLPKRAKCQPQHRDVLTPASALRGRGRSVEGSFKGSSIAFKKRKQLAQVVEIENYRATDLWMISPGENVQCEWCDSECPVACGVLCGAEGASQFAQHQFICRDCFTSHYGDDAVLDEDCEGEELEEEFQEQAEQVLEDDELEQLLPEELTEQHLADERAEPLVLEKPAEPLVVQEAQAWQVLPKEDQEDELTEPKGQHNEAREEECEEEECEVW